MRLSLKAGFSEQCFSRISYTTLRKTRNTLSISLIVTELGMSLVLALAGSQGPWHQCLPFRQPVFPICIPLGQSSPSLGCRERAGTLAGNAELSDLAQLGPHGHHTTSSQEGGLKPSPKGEEELGSRGLGLQGTSITAGSSAPPDGGTEQQEVRATL